MYLGFTIKFAALKFVEYLCGDRQGLNVPFGGTSVKYKTITSADNKDFVNCAETEYIHNYSYSHIDGDNL